MRKILEGVIFGLGGTEGVCPGVLKVRRGSVLEVVSHEFLSHLLKDGAKKA